MGVLAPADDSFLGTFTVYQQLKLQEIHIWATPKRSRGTRSDLYITYKSSPLQLSLGRTPVRATALAIRLYGLTAGSIGHDEVQ